MKKVPLKLRLFLAGLGFFALSGSAHETTFNVEGEGRGIVTIGHWVTPGRAQNGLDEARKLALTNAQSVADDKCQGFHGYLINPDHPSRADYVDLPVVPSAGGFSVSANVKARFRCALPSQDRDVRISDTSEGKGHLVTHADGSIWNEGRGISVLIREAHSSAGSAR